MGSFIEDENLYFDAQEDISSAIDVNSDTFGSNFCSTNWILANLCHKGWIGSPRSVEERRNNFFRWMELNADKIDMDNSVEINDEDRCREFDKTRVSSEAVVRTTSPGNEFCSSWSLVSCLFDSSSGVSGNMEKNENFTCIDAKLEYQMDGSSMEHNKNTKECYVANLDQGFSRELEAPPLSSSAQQVIEREVKNANDLVGIMKRIKKGWVNRLRSMSCIVDREGLANKLRLKNDDTFPESRAQRVKVRQCKKQLKELSALYMQQDIQAHKGAILTMKFSPDGQYLASAGEDGVVRVWQVVEDERSGELDIPEIDPACLYFTVNHLTELKPLFADKDKMEKSRNMRKTSDSACVIFPSKIFRILERPIHELHGHTHEILDISWSKNNYLLSSSVDKTVRLWQVGCDYCLKIFSHSNYVTCIQFNPVDDDYFISGSIDGKVRIWGISCCQVVDWIDIREIITALCYCPDGKGGIIGSISGNCHFLNVSDNQVQLDAQMCLHNKKKAPCKRITGFQFSPLDSSIVMVTSADAKVRILHGLNITQKYGGLSNPENQLSAYFTSDGKHIVSACEDSNVYVWNCSDIDETVLSQERKVKAWERFYTNASVAIPWNGMRRDNSDNGGQLHLEDCLSETVHLSSPPCFKLSKEFVSEPFLKGSVTWPEEKLPPSSPQVKPTKVHISQLKFLKASCQNTSNSHAWGLVIVTAGWDGRIKSFHNYGLPVYL